jgi:hypothetical protein
MEFFVFVFAIWVFFFGWNPNAAWHGFQMLWTKTNIASPLVVSGLKETLIFRYSGRLKFLRDISIVIQTRLTDIREARVWFPGGHILFPSSQPPDRLWSSLTSYPIVTGYYFSRSKSGRIVDMMSHFHLVSRVECMERYLQSFIWISNVFNYLFVAWRLNNRGRTLTFYNLQK